MMKNIRRAEF